MASTRFVMNMQPLMRDLDKLKKATQSQKAQFLEGTGFIIQKNIVTMIDQLGLVDTGRFKGSITSDVQGEVLTVRDGVSYGKYLEFGTIGHGPTTAKRLSWVDRTSGQRIFAKWVRGIPAFAPFQNGLNISEPEIYKWAGQWYDSLT